LINVIKEIKKRKLTRSGIINQVYDSAWVDAHPEDEEEIDRIYYDYSANKLKEEFDWIIVPLRVEKEKSAVDGNLAEMENCGILKF
jgi:hypothetical protein